MMRDAARTEDCAGAALLVSAEPARGQCRRSVGLLDRFTVWRDGAHAVWIEEGGVRIVSDRGYRGNRPWVPPVPTPRRVAPNLPMAPSETLPADDG
jgi:competence protein ComEC